MFDLLIQNGTVLDGTGAPRFRADVAVKDERIVLVRPNITGAAEKVIDASGLYVTTGFIDTHSHANKIVLFPNISYNILLQGITFQFMGQCGDSPVPYTENLMGAFKESLCAEEFAAMREKISSPARFVEEAKKQRFGVNIGFFLGHQAMWAAIMGYKSGDPSENEMRQMKTLLEQAMQAGYWA